MNIDQLKRIIIDQKEELEKDAISVFFVMWYKLCLSRAKPRGYMLYAMCCVLRVMREAEVKILFYRSSHADRLLGIARYCCPESEKLFCKFCLYENSTLACPLALVFQCGAMDNMDFFKEFFLFFSLFLNLFWQALVSFFKLFCNDNLHVLF